MSYNIVVKKIWVVEQETVTDEISPEPGTSLTVHSGLSG